MNKGVYAEIVTDSGIVMLGLDFIRHKLQGLFKNLLW